MKRLIKRAVNKQRKQPIIQTVTHHLLRGGRYGGETTNGEKHQIISPLGEYEYQGKGLPERIERSDECHFIVNSFDVRMKHGEEDGTLEYSYAFKNTTTHTVVPFKGIPKNKTCKAKGDFDRNLYNIIEQTCFFVAEAVVKNQTDDFEKKKELFDTFIDHLSFEFKVLLKLGHFKVIDQFIDEHGRQVVEKAFIDYGAQPKAEEEVEREKEDFLADVYSAFHKFKQNHVTNPKQKNLMRFLFTKHKDQEKKISEMFKKHNLDFKNLWRLFNLTDNYKDFMRNIHIARKVTA